MRDLTIDDKFHLCALLVRYSHELTLKMNDIIEGITPAGAIAKLQRRQGIIEKCLDECLKECAETAFNSFDKDQE